MSDLRITDTSIRNGVWTAGVEGGDAAPDIQVQHLGQDVPGVSVEPASGEAGWRVTLPIPSECIGDGVQTFLVLDGASGETIGDFCVIAGEALGDDIRAEVTLLREELDLLKRAFRRHCVESAGEGS